MSDIITTIINAPIPTILIVVGAIFLYIAIGGRYKAAIVTGRINPKLAGILGSIFMIIGLVIHLITIFPHVPDHPGITPGQSELQKKLQIIATSEGLVDPNRGKRREYIWDPQGSDDIQEWEGFKCDDIGNYQNYCGVCKVVKERDGTRLIAEMWLANKDGGRIRKEFQNGVSLRAGAEISVSGHGKTLTCRAVEILQ